MKPAQSPPRRSWRSLFSRSKAAYEEYYYSSKLAAVILFHDRKDLFFLGSSGFYCSGLYLRCDELPEWREIDLFLRAVGIRKRCFESSSPGNATKYSVFFDFLDGGFETHAGDYFFGPKGAYVVGIKALRFLCFGLGLTQPRRFKGEVSVPSRKDLEGEIREQQKDALTERKLAGEALPPTTP
jgi:hypothetical protein